MLGPLSRLSEPHAYDLCRDHASRMTAPRGWELLRIAGGEEASDDLVALADALRPRPATTGPAGPDGAPADPSATGPRGARRATASEEPPVRHLHVVRGSDD